jgi:hypothetical protein
LNLQLFDSATLGDLVRIGNAMERSIRPRIYNEFVSTFKNSHPLPQVASAGTNVPNVIADHVDRLYMSMAAIDYKLRPVGFERIFARIERIELLLKNQAKYREWKRRRDVFRLHATEKQNRKVVNISLKRNGVQV